MEKMKEEPKCILFVSGKADDIDYMEKLLETYDREYRFFRIADSANLNKIETISPDIIVIDYASPLFDKIIRYRKNVSIDKNVFVIAYSRSQNYREVVKCIKSGASDYILWDDIDTLPDVVNQTFTQIEENKQKRMVDAFGLLRHYVSQMPIGFLRTDVYGMAVYANKEWCAITGFNVNSTKGSGWLNAIHPDDKEVFFNTWNEKFNSQKSSELRLVRPDGSVAWVIFQFAPIINYGQIIGYAGIITDVSHIKRTYAEKRGE